MKIEEKTCSRCNEPMLGASRFVQYCEPCKKLTIKENQERCRLKKKKISDEIHNLKYIDNFNKITTSAHFLTPKGFNSASDKKVKSYVQFYDCTWIDLIKKFGRYNELFQYVCTEYKKYYESTSKQNLSEFSKKHKYINYDLVLGLGTDEIMNACGIKKLRYSDEEYRINFLSIANRLGHIPLYHEFDLLSKIPMESYSYRYKIKGKVYDTIVKMYTNNEEYAQYLINKRKHKSEVGKITGPMSAQNSLEDYEVEFKRVFEECLSRFGVNPPRRLFNKLSKFDDRSYRKRLNMSWLDICSYYGYAVDKTANNSERIVLESISSILGEKFVPQKTWDWLIGIGGKHMYCDGYYPSANLVIEFDGVQHRKPISSYGGEKSHLRLVANDNLKNELLAQHNIKLIRIDSREPWHDTTYLSQKLRDNGFIIHKYNQVEENIS